MIYLPYADYFMERISYDRDCGSKVSLKLAKLLSIIVMKLRVTANNERKIH